MINAFCIAAFVAATGIPAPTVESFDTATPARVDPVFADAFALRRSIDEFLGMQNEMEAVRDRFAIAIHETLGKLPDRHTPGKACPVGVADLYRRSYAAGSLYLKLGHRLRELFRDIQRADAYGDAVALTPDYRLRTKQANSTFSDLLRDYREMRVAFHEQLGTELRYAGCSVRGWLTIGRSTSANLPDAGDPEEWNLDRPLEQGVVATALPNVAPTQVGRPKGKSPPPAPASAQAIWMTIDNGKCPRPTRLSIDGLPLGEIPPKRRVTVRARAGARELCLLAEGDTKVCGEPGTLRKVYLYEGLTLTVHCARPK